MLMKLRVAVLSGGPSPEHDISLATGKVITRALDRTKYDVREVVIPRTGPWLPDATGRAFADVAFLALHGRFGEDGTIQGLLDFAQIPYTGSGVLASALAMDKVRASALLATHRFDVPHEYSSHDDIQFPCVVKPSAAGSSVGISIVRDPNDLDRAISHAREFDNVVIIQEYIQGSELTCAVLDEGDNKPRALAPTEIIPKSSEFFDYTAKYTRGGSEEVTPARQPADIITRLQDAAVRAHTILGCRGLSRSDFILRDNVLYFLELNTMPGMTETSLYPQAAAAVGLSFPDLLDRIIQSSPLEKRG